MEIDVSLKNSSSHQDNYNENDLYVSMSYWYMTKLPNLSGFKQWEFILFIILHPGGAQEGSVVSALAILVGTVHL